jgi:hypothetical protein
MEMETDAKDSLCSYLPKECSIRRMSRNKTKFFESTVNKHEGHREMQISKKAFGSIYKSSSTCGSYIFKSSFKL